MTIATSYYNSPVGWLHIVADDLMITKVLFMDDLQDQVSMVSPVLHQCMQQLDLYFSGKLEKFTVPVSPSGTTFQRKVWAELQGIPFAKTTSYAQLAHQVGDIKSIRAVGTANGKNPVAIIIPCHRVIGSDGSLTGYGGGLWRKKWLLDFERKQKQGDLFE